MSIIQGLQSRAEPESTEAGSKNLTWMLYDRRAKYPCTAIDSF